MRTPIESFNALQRSRVEQTMQNLPLAMEKLPAFEGMVFRGGEMLPRLDPAGPNLKIGEIIATPGFLSASRDFLVVSDTYLQSNNGPRTLLVIHSKRGKGLPEELQLNSSEREVLFLPRTKFKVRSVDTVNDGQVVELEEI